MITYLVVFIVVLLLIHVANKEYNGYYRRKRSLKGRIVLMTGSANGLGKDICLAFAREQCDIICVDIDEKGNEDTIKQCKQISKNIRVVGFTCDITDPKNIRELSKKVYAEFDHVDILYNNAGVAYPAKICALTDEQVKRIVDVNLVSNMWTIRTFLPRMIERKRGLIVATSSVAGRLGVDCLAPYCATKFGVTGLMDSLKNELNVEGCKVRTLTVHPGFMSTQLLPKRMRNPGVMWLKPYRPLHIVTTEDTANEIMNAIKEGKTRIYYPYYNIVGINFVKYFLPQFIGDWIMSNIIVLGEHIDPL